MIKKFLLSVFMASLMLSVQFSFTGCEDNDDSGPDVSGSADQYAATNDYNVNARIINFGGLYTCADIEVTKDGSVVEDAISENGSISDLEYKIEDLEYKVQNFEDFNQDDIVDSVVREVFSQLSQKFITDSQVIVAKSHLDDLASKIKTLEAKLSETDTNQNPTQ